jgi:hypothetical protein
MEGETKDGTEIMKTLLEHIKDKAKEIILLFSHIRFLK